MTPIDFPQSNSVFNPPPNLDKSQCKPIPAFVGDVEGGNIDGASVITVAWLPSEKEKQQIANGSPIFLTCMSAIPPHFLTTEFPFFST